MCREKKVEMVIEYLRENEEVFNELMENLDSYNGYIGRNKYYEMDRLDEFYPSEQAKELLRGAFRGYDADTYTTNSLGKRTHGAFNFNRRYFFYDSNWNIASTNHKDYTDKLDGSFIDSVIENINRLYIDDSELLEMLEDIE